MDSCFVPLFNGVRDETDVDCDIRGCPVPDSGSLCHRWVTWVPSSPWDCEEIGAGIKETDPHNQAWMVQATKLGSETLI